jgi:uncharacterized protein YndB with AHSA1/START domain
MKPQDKELLITRTFNAPIDQVFEAWTDPEKLKHWYAPEGCTIDYIFIEIKEGGRFHYRINHPTHGSSWVIGRYTEILHPEKLTYTIQLSNENGDVLNPNDAKSAGWPGEILITVTFESEGSQTKATIHEAVPEEKARKTGAYQGWIEMFDKLDLHFTKYSKLQNQHRNEQNYF